MPLRRRMARRLGAMVLPISAASLTLFVRTTVAIQNGAPSGVDSTLQLWTQLRRWRPLDLLTDAANFLCGRRQLALRALSIAIVLMGIDAARLAFGNRR